MKLRYKNQRSISKFNVLGMASGISTGLNINLKIDIVTTRINVEVLIHQDICDENELV